MLICWKEHILKRQWLEERAQETLGASSVSFIQLRVAGAWPRRQRLRPWRPLTGHQSITGPKKQRDGHILEAPVNRTSISLDRENPCKKGLGHQREPLHHRAPLSNWNICGKVLFGVRWENLYFYTGSINVNLAAANKQPTWIWKCSLQSLINVPFVCV